MKIHVVTYLLLVGRLVTIRYYQHSSPTWASYWSPIHFSIVSIDWNSNCCSINCCSCIFPWYHPYMLIPLIVFIYLINNDFTFCTKWENWAETLLLIADSTFCMTNLCKFAVINPNVLHKSLINCWQFGVGCTILKYSIITINFYYIIKQFL